MSQPTKCLFGTCQAQLGWDAKLRVPEPRELLGFDSVPRPQFVEGRFGAIAQQHSAEVKSYHIVPDHGQHRIFGRG